MLNWIHRVLDGDDHLVRRKDLVTLVWTVVTVVVVLVANSLVS